MDYFELDSLFHPHSMAVIGANPDLMGAIHLSSMLKFGFKGEIYPINRAGEEVLGVKAYKSLTEIPGPVDFAFIQVPAKASSQVIRDCGAKGIKLATMFTAGFGESENEWGKEVEKELIKAIRESGVRVLGPNCMGLYNPAVRLTFGPEFPTESGPVGALCQSGGNAHQIIYSGKQRGLRFSKVISYGNAIDLNETELLEYFTRDPRTEIVIAYIEGVKDGKRFFQTLKKAAQTKPVIVLKGGQTPAGAVATLSHTSSLAGSKEIWDSLIKQAGAIPAQNIDDCVDIATALRLIKPPAGRKAVVIGFGGGASVQLADDCYRAGLRFPPIPDHVKEKLKKVTSVSGSIYQNPVDVLTLFINPNEFENAIKVLGNWTGADILILNQTIEISGAYTGPVTIFEPSTESFIKAVKETGKPAVVVTQAVYSETGYQIFLRIRQKCTEEGIAFYSSIYQAASAIDKLIRYQERPKTAY